MRLSPRTLAPLAPAVLAILICNFPVFAQQPDGPQTDAPPAVARTSAAPRARRKTYGAFRNATGSGAWRTAFRPAAPKPAIRFTFILRFR